MQDGLSERRTRRSWFCRGFRQRNPLVLVVAAALAGVALLALQSFVIDGGLTSIPESRLLRITHDDYLHIAYRVSELREDPPNQPTVYLFGGSGTMECFVDEDSLAAAISKDAGRKVGVVSLAAHQQSLAMTLALIDNLPAGTAYVVIGLAPIRVTTAPEKDARLLSGRPVMLRSERLASLGERLYGTGASVTGAIPGIFDFLGSYLKARDGRSGRPHILEKVTYAKHYYPKEGRPNGASPLQKRLNVLTVLADDAKLYARNSAYNLEVLEEILKLARDRGFTAVLYDQPLNTSAAEPTWHGVVPAYRRACRRLAAEYGVAYIQPQRSVDLVDADFADLFHLLPRGRVKWQPVMARELGEAVRAAGSERLAARDVRASTTDAAR